MIPAQRATIFAAVMIALTTAVAAQQSPAAKIPCYADMAQDYEWETQFGKGIPSPLVHCPDAPAWSQEWSQKGAGRMQIRLRGQEIWATEEDYTWVPQLDGSGVCTGVMKYTRKMTHVVKNGVQYDLHIETDHPDLRSTQKVDDIGAALPPPDSEANVGPFVTKGDTYLEIVGTETIAGHVCTRTSTRPGLPHITACEIAVAPQCVLYYTMKPLEYIGDAPDGTEMIHARTTLLQFGALGEVVPANAITPP
jgi:hypothetical protein